MVPDQENLAEGGEARSSSRAASRKGSMLPSWQGCMRNNKIRRRTEGLEQGDSAPNRSIVFENLKCESRPARVEAKQDTEWSTARNVPRGNQTLVWIRCSRGHAHGRASGAEAMPMAEHCRRRRVFIFQRNNVASRTYITLSSALLPPRRWPAGMCSLCRTR